MKTRNELIPFGVRALQTSYLNLLTLILHNYQTRQRQRSSSIRIQSIIACLSLFFCSFSKKCPRISFPALICSPATVCADLCRRETPCGCSVTVRRWVANKINQGWLSKQAEAEEKKKKRQGGGELTVSWPAGGRKLSFNRRHVGNKTYLPSSR